MLVMDVPMEITVQTKALQSPKLCLHFLGSSPRLFSELLELPELPELGVQAMPGPSPGISWDFTWEDDQNPIVTLWL
jgi:hypothetical protein